jgi:hypothetical protein
MSSSENGTSHDSKSIASSKSITTQPAAHVHDHKDVSLVECGKHSLFNFLNSFVLAYGIRTGVSVLLRAIQLFKQRPKDLMSLQKLFDERHLIVRVDAVRLGLTFGCTFFSIFPFFFFFFF